MTSLQPVTPAGVDLVSLEKVANSEHTLRTQESSLPFSIEWVVHFNERLAKLSADEPLILMISSQQPQLMAQFRTVAQRVPMIMQDKTARAGIIIVGNAPGSRGCWIPANGRSMSELVEWAEANGAQSEFSLAGTAGSQRTIVFPAGLEKDDLSYSVDHVIVDELLTTEDIQESLNRFCASVLNASDVNTKLWEDRKAWIPVTTAEKCIQDQLMIFFRGQFISPSDLVLQELNNSDGRCDLLVKSKHLDKATMSSRVREFVLELKALKSFTVGQNEIIKSQHEAALEKGLQQARDYKKTLKAEVVFLCVFDLRKSAADDLKIWTCEECKKEEIVPWWDVVLPTTDERRNRKMAVAAS